jgi:hypothetical protein
LGKLGLDISERTVSRLLRRRHRPPSQTWRTFLTNHCYHGARTHLSLAKDAPTPRRVQAITEGEVIAFPEVGGLHHRYERRAA